MCEYEQISLTLASASKYHMVVKKHDNRENEKLVIFGPRFSSPND